MSEQPTPRCEMLLAVTIPGTSTRSAIPRRCRGLARWVVTVSPFTALACDECLARSLGHRFHWLTPLADPPVNPYALEKPCSTPTP